MSILLDQITKRYQGAPVVNDVSLEIAEGEFFVLRGAEFPDDEHIQRQAKRRRDLPRDWNAAARKAKDDRILPVGERNELVGQQSARLMSVVEGSHACLRATR